MIKTKFLLLVASFMIFILGMIFTLRFIIGGDEDTWICQNGQWQKHGNPSTAQPLTACLVQRQKIN